MSDGEAQLSAGRAVVAQLVSLAIRDGDIPDSAETELGAALAALRSAMNWLEGTPLFDNAHEVLDAGGRLARRFFPHGCALAFREGTYFQECPVALAHNRAGFSIGYTVREAECSICHLDPEDCSHIRGRMYDGERCVRIVKRLDLDEISIVETPASPDARIMSVSVEWARLVDALGVGGG